VRKVPETCDWCGGEMKFIARQPYLETVDELVYHCENCHHELVAYAATEETK
jgi:C4-type Zn-finger protein